MEKYKYIIVDDEPLFHLKLNSQFNDYAHYSCAATFHNPNTALNYLKKNKIDLIFLDIEMPEMNGLQFMESLDQQIFVVILTAYPNKYGFAAHKYYEENLFFYTNKAQLLYYFPKIITRFEKLFAEREMINRINQLSKNEIYTFPKKVNNETLLLTDIRIIEVVGHHLVLKLRRGEEHIFRMTLGEVKKFLPAHLFFHIRRNIIINIMYVTAFNDLTICLEDAHFVVTTVMNKNIISDLKTALEALRN